MARYLSDGSMDAPKLRVAMNMGTLMNLPEWSIWPGLGGAEALERLKSDGFEAVQGGDEELLHRDILPVSTSGRVNLPNEADEVVGKSASSGGEALTLHVGWGIENEDVVDRLVEAILDASERYEHPVFIETHRATITQDPWRTIRVVEKFPEVRFNGDFSHYYCGLEMPYGGCELKWDFMAPIFERVGYLHGRIAAPGFMQAPIENASDRPRAALGADYLADFKEMWRRSMAGFKRNAGPGGVLVFAPELLPPEISYARVFPDAKGNLVEEVDRYEQALIYRDIAREVFAGA